MNKWVPHVGCPRFSCVLTLGHVYESRGQLLRMHIRVEPLATPCSCTRPQITHSKVRLAIFVVCGCCVSSHHHYLLPQHPLARV